jgi:hypothetical protein
MSAELMLLATGRTAGKTTQAIAWLSNGERVRGYPGWSRVLVVQNQQMLQWTKSHWWGDLEDFDHRVYDLQTWLNARSVRPETEVCLDDLDALLRGRMLGWIPGQLVAATMTAAPWEPQTFREREQQPRYVP